MFKFRWLTRLALAVGFVGALVAAPAVGGIRLTNRAEATSVQSVTGTWVSAVTVLNPSTSPATANVTLTFYDPTGNQIVGATQNTAIGVGGTQVWFVPNITGLSQNVTYSAVVSADQQVYATVNLATAQGSVPSMGETYNGVDTTQVATSASVPSVLRSYFGYTSNIVVQNTGATAASVTITFNGANPSPVSFTTPAQAINANASFTFDLNSYSQLGTNFIGSATVNGGSNNVAVIGNNYTLSTVATGPSTTGYLFSSANATTATSGSATNFVPALYNYYYGYYSALIVENVDTTAAAVTVQYSTGQKSTITLQPNTSANFFTPNFGSSSDASHGIIDTGSAFPAGAAVSATVTTGGGQKIVSVVNISGSTAAIGGVDQSGGLASYNGFGSGFKNAFVPGLDKKYFGFSSSLTVQNVDSVPAPAGSISVAYSNTVSPVVDTGCGGSGGLAPGAVCIIYTPNEPGLPTGWTGGATVTSSTAKIVAVENISGPSDSDQLFSTNGFGQ